MPECFATVPSARSGPLTMQRMSDRKSVGSEWRTGRNLGSETGFGLESPVLRNPSSLTAPRPLKTRRSTREAALSALAEVRHGTIGRQPNPLRISSGDG